MSSAKNKPADRPLLIFDLDGTLMDTRRDIATAVNLMRKEYGLLPLPLDTITGYVGDGIQELVRRSLADRPGTDIGEATRICATRYSEHLHDETLPYPGVREGLEQLRAAGYALAMVSNKPGALCRTLLEHFGIMHLFDCVLGGGDTQNLKPHPEPLVLAVRKTGATAAGSWMIGDHRTDLEAARRAGLPGIFLTHGMGKTGTEKPAAVLHTFDELTAYLLARKGLSE